MMPRVSLIIRVHFVLSLEVLHTTLTRAKGRALVSQKAWQYFLLQEIIPHPAINSSTGGILPGTSLPSVLVQAFAGRLILRSSLPWTAQEHSI